ncbi:MAG: ATP-binding protein [Coriobacteriales bacterium]|nr:ATP-binding protein [Coriobacteriales bacterium]
MQNSEEWQVGTLARIAVYDDMLSAPRIIDIAPAPVRDFIESIASTAYEFSRRLGGSLPYTVIREITENFIHANFAQCTVSILDGGDTIRFSDQGPGIPKKSLVLQPGVSSATEEMRKYIKGVGSGLPIVKEYLERSQGFLSIEDNAAEGVVVTIAVAAPTLQAAPSPASAISHSLRDTAGAQGHDPTSPVVSQTAVELQPDGGVAHYGLLPRDEKTLILLLEEGMLGPVDLATSLGVSAPTATRILQKLESMDMVEITHLKKRILSNAGHAYVQRLLSTGKAG